MANRLNVVGKRFNRFLVIADEGKKSKAGKTIVLCRCDCGNERDVIASGLINGNSKSCGCLKSEVTSEIRKKHGLSKTSMYYRYRHMIKRCYDESNDEYHNYGGRGIKVCDRWLESIENYIEDMGNPPFDMASIDRIDNNLGYSKDNCKWSSKKEQSVNRRTTKMIEFNGESLCLADWARKLGCSKKAVADRLKAGWTIEEALTLPKGAVIRVHRRVI